jgi:hypothetical protein
MITKLESCTLQKYTFILKYGKRNFAIEKLSYFHHKEIYTKGIASLGRF